MIPYTKTTTTDRKQPPKIVAPLPSSFFSLSLFLLALGDHAKRRQVFSTYRKSCLDLSCMRGGVLVVSTTPTSTDFPADHRYCRLVFQVSN